MTKDKTATGTVKGVIRKYNDQSLEFTPFGKGEPVYEEQQKFKNGVTIAKTRGANGKRVVRIPLEAADVDQVTSCRRSSYVSASIKLRLDTDGVIPML